MVDHWAESSDENLVVPTDEWKAVRLAVRLVAWTVEKMVERLVAWMVAMKEALLVVNWAETRAVWKVAHLAACSVPYWAG